MTTYSDEVDSIFNKLATLRAFLLKDDPNKQDTEEYDEMSIDEANMLKSDIQSKLTHGWYAIEAYEYLQNSEHINPLLDEDIAITRMTRIHTQIMLRLGLDNLAA